MSTTMLLFALALQAQAPTQNPSQTQTTPSQTQSPEVYDIHVIGFPAVQKEIGLDPTEAAKILRECTEAEAKARTFRSGQSGPGGQAADPDAFVAAAHAKAAQALTPAQLKRVNELALQRMTLAGMTPRDLAKTLDLSESQVNSLREINARYPRDVAGTGVGGGGGGGGGAGNNAAAGRGAGDAEHEKARAAREEAIWGLLTAQQKSKWQSLKGQPFDWKAAEEQARQAQQGNAGQSGDGGRGGTRR
jgi:DNA-binding CsgD family transcriptional regulator